MLLEGSGRYGVAIQSKAKKELLKKGSADQRAELDNLIRRYVAGGPTTLPRNKFAGDEGWFPSKKSPGKVRLEAFKPWTLRAYGFCGQLDGRGVFFITGIDTKKKQDDANPAILQSAGTEAFRVSKLLK
jgi:hypothetical protein